MASRSSSRKILDQIAQLKNALEGFSFDELTIEEAKALKRSFESFKIKLENGIWGHEIDPRHMDIDSILSGELKGMHGGGGEESQLESKDNSVIHRLYFLIDTLYSENRTEPEINQLSAIRTFLKQLEGNNPIKLDNQSANSVSKPVQAHGPSFSPKQVIDQVDFIGNTLITTDLLSLFFDIDPNLPDFIYGSSSQFYELLMKLIGTRITDVSSGELEVNVYLTPSESDQILNIKLLERISFEPKSYPNQKDAANTFGLIELSQLVEKYEGKFWLGNNAGRHAAIHLQIPVIPVHHAASPKATPSEIKPLSGKTILVLHHPEKIDHVLIGNIQEWGGKIITDTDTLKGLQKIQERHVDLIVLPLEMDGVDAFQACMRIRNSHKATARKIPVLCVADDLCDRDIQNLKRVGINDILLAEDSSEKLLRAILANVGSQSGYSGLELKISKTPKMESIWQKILLESDGHADAFNQRMWLYKSEMITHLGALKVHLTLLDYEQLKKHTLKLSALLTYLQIDSWIVLIKEFNSLVDAGAGAQRMRQLYRSMLESYEHWDVALQEFILNLRK